MSTLTHKFRLTVALGTATLLIAACSSSSPDSGNAAENLDVSALEEGYVGIIEDPGEPIEGGTLNWAGRTQPLSLDPAATIAALTTGGVELMNIYDTLLRYDAESQEFVPRLAKAIESEDNRTWTLTLRDDVQFSDGDRLDAAAVKWSQERYGSLSAPEAGLWNANVADIATPDETTVVYRLKKPWPKFPGMLTTGPGMIVDDDSVGDGEEFTPIGAGAFTLKNYAPQESITLEANKSYWGGEPHLDGIRFVYLPDEPALLDSMKAGEIDATYVREPEIINEVLAGDPHAYVNVTSAANVGIINAAEGRPGADVRVRKAMQLALDPDVMMGRSYGGGPAGSSLFGDYSRWHTDTEGLPYDPESARSLLDEAKADGFDGKIKFIETSDPSSRQSALTFKALLEKAGFDVQLDIKSSVGDMITSVVSQDYDVSIWGHSFREADPFPKMFATMHSQGTSLYGAETSPEMDALLEKFQTAPTYEEQLAVMDQIQQQVNEDVPFVVWSPVVEFVTWTNDVRGVVGGASSMVFFADAWKGAAAG